MASKPSPDRAWEWREAAMNFVRGGAAVAALPLTALAVWWVAVRVDPVSEVAQLLGGLLYFGGGAILATGLLFVVLGGIGLAARWLWLRVRNA